jgi:hypothetical protein
MEKEMLENHVVKPRIVFNIEGKECRLIGAEDEHSMDTKISVIEEFMANNHGFGKEDSVKDELYAGAKELWRQYAAVLRDVKYTFYMNRKQFNFITNLLLTKLEYDVNTIFFAIELTNMLGSWEKEGAGKNDTEIRTYTADATEVTYMYHLIAKHKIKGLTSDTYMFADILRKIGDISKVINYYDTAAKNLSKEIQGWVASFEPEETTKDEPAEDKA